MNYVTNTCTGVTLFEKQIMLNSFFKVLFLGNNCGLNYPEISLGGIPNSFLKHLVK